MSASLSLYVQDRVAAPMTPPTPLPDHDAACSVVSPMLLADRMLRLAEHAHAAGLCQTASRLVLLAHTVFDEVPTLSIN